MSLYQIYRPTNFENMVGDFDFIKRILDSPDGNHAFLFSGSFGCGKTTLARACAAYLKADSMDIREYNFSDTRGIDTVREIIALCKYQPFEGKSVFIIDEVHGLTTDASNAFLKILEDVPPYVYFFLCTSNPKKVIESIRNRCVKAFLYPLEEEELYDLVTNIAEKEGFNIPRRIRMTVAEKAKNSARDAINLLEAVAGMSVDSALKYLENSKTGFEADAEVGPVIEAVLSEDFQGFVKALNALPEKKYTGEAIRFILIDVITKNVMAKPHKYTLRLLDSLVAGDVTETNGYGALLVRVSRAFE